MILDKRIINFKKLKYEYPNDFEDFMLMLNLLIINYCR